MLGVNTQCNAETPVRKQVCFTHILKKNAYERVCVLSSMHLNHINSAKPAQTKWE